MNTFKLWIVSLGYFIKQVLPLISENGAQKGYNFEELVLYWKGGAGGSTYLRFWIRVNYELFSLYERQGQPAKRY